MEQVGINNVQHVQYQPKTAATEPSFQGKKPEMKEDGDKKLLGALVALGATAAAGIAIYKNKAKIGDFIGKIAKKGTQKTGIKPGSKEAIVHSKKIVKNVSKEAQEKFNKLTDGVQTALKNKKAYEALEAKVSLGEKAISAAEKAGKTRVVFDGKEMDLSRAKGLLSNAQGELKKMPKIGEAEVKKAVAAVTSETKKPEMAGIAKMQRVARKHPEVSQESLAKIANAVPTKTTTPASEIAERYNKYVEIAQKKNKTPMTFEKFIQKTTGK